MHDKKFVILVRVDKRKTTICSFKTRKAWSVHFDDQNGYKHTNVGFNFNHMFYMNFATK